MFLVVYSIWRLKIYIVIGGIPLLWGFSVRCSRDKATILTVPFHFIELKMFEPESTAIVPQMSKPMFVILRFPKLMHQVGKSESPPSSLKDILDKFAIVVLRRPLRGRCPTISHFKQFD